jgi:hypothetical protein
LQAENGLGSIEKTHAQHFAREGEKEQGLDEHETRQPRQKARYGHRDGG